LRDLAQSPLPINVIVHVGPPPTTTILPLVVPSLSGLYEGEDASLQEGISLSRFSPS